MKNNILVTVIGATAIGKTNLAISLAKHFGCEIISSDSRQFFKEMSIGTAAPDKEELASVNHHFIKNISIFSQYSVGQFERDAIQKLDDLFNKNPVQIMVGGSGLYIDAVLKGLDNFPDVPEKIRKKLNEDFNNKGIEYLQKQLKKLDISSYKSIAIDNPHRLIRALEVCIGTGKTYSSFKNKPKAMRNFKPIMVGLTADREIIYNRINKRVDIMIKKGLLNEVKLLHKHKQINALQTVGYRELFNYLDGKYDFNFAIEEIKKNTRRFAKRQITWFKKYENALWFNYQENENKIIEEIEQVIKKKYF